jgi:hypothetical protein
MKESKKIELTAEEILKHKDELADIKAVMGTVPGRRFMWRMMEEGNIFRTCFTGNSQTFYLLGKRDFMIPYYQDVMEACPELWAKAQTENFKKGE